MTQCYKCTDRFVGCHSQCELYQAYRKKLNDKNRKNLMASDATEVRFAKLKQGQK